MGLNVSRSVEIQISNNTQYITLKNPRTYFYSGQSLTSSLPSVLPGSSKTCKFTNKTRFWGCNGVLAFEAKSFTLAIYFSNPIDYNRFSVEMGLELSTDKVHLKDLESAYDRLVKFSDRNPLFPSIILKESEEQIQLSAGPVKVMATMSRGRSAVIRVKVEERKNSGNEAGVKSSCRARHVQEK